MKLYIDKENLISLMKSRNQSEFNDCYSLIRKNFDVLYNFPKSALKSDELLMAWFSSYGEGVKGEKVFAEKGEEILPPRPLKSNFYNSGDAQWLLSAYLLNDAHICDVINKKSCILIGTIGDELNVINSLIIEDSEILASEITSWSDYLPNLPLTDIIISDNHYFKSLNTYRANNNELLRYLCSIPNNSPVNVVIITKENELDPNIDLETEKDEIKKMVKNITGSTKSSVTILTTYKTHDRALITNYYRVKHGCCFHLNDNGLKKDVLTEIKSHAYINNERISENLISGIFQDIASSPARCFGDKKSNFLNF